MHVLGSWKTLVFAACVLTYAVAAASARGDLPKADFFVATNGSDSWSGTLAAPTKNRDDGPFATVDRARQAVRELRAGRPDRQVTVLVRGGTYFLDKPLVFTPEDSGAAGAPVTYGAYPGEKPVISGGVSLTGWRRDPEGRWQVEIPAVKNGEWYFSQLFVNGERRFRPRLPKNGYYYITARIPPSSDSKTGHDDRFGFRPGDIRGDWANLGDVEVLCFHVWTMSRMRIASVDTQARTVTLTGSVVGKDWAFDLARGTRYLVENVREALSRPGEWYLDRQSGILTYIPKPSEDMRKCDVVAPRLEHVLKLRGDPAAGRWVSNIVFRGIAFQHSNWNTPAEGYSCSQADFLLRGAVIAEGVRKCKFIGCSFKHTGTYALEIDSGSRYNVVEGCEFRDMGSGGIKIERHTDYPDSPDRVTGFNLIRNNLIAHGGRTHPAGCGIAIGHSPFNRVEHNEICDFYNTGISVGWFYGDGAHHNRIEYNHIHHLGYQVTSDMGGIYTIGNQPGTVLQYNRIHDVNGLKYGGWGIYLDEYSSSILVRNNLCYRNNSAGFHIHYGQDNKVTNNIFAFNGAQIARTRPTEQFHATFEHNIAYWDKGSLLGGDWSGDGYAFDYNLYWRANGEPIRPAWMSFEDWRRKGMDIHSVIADPLFVDASGNDFRLKPNSPAQQIGFKPFDIRSAGRVGATSEEPVSGVPVYPPPPPPFFEDFESTPVGEQPLPGETAEGGTGKGSIRVTDETAASGKHSLKLAHPDGSDWLQVLYDLRATSGIVQVKFDMRVEPGAGARVDLPEWHDDLRQSVLGPSIRIEGDGTLRANGQEIGRIPPGKWLHYEITLGLGPRCTGTYDLTVGEPGRSSDTYRRLGYDPRYGSLSGAAFIADGDRQGVFYLDNVQCVLMSSGTNGRTPGLRGRR